jgi:methylmalonyl-CoA/ethylmalonyl-CoA epimerase
LRAGAEIKAGEIQSLRLTAPQAGIEENVPEDKFRPLLGEPHHHAYVVDAIEATVERLVEQLGAGPFFLIENVPLEKVLSRGEPAQFVHNSAFGSYDGGAIELMETLDLAPARVEKQFSGPRPRIQHLGYAVPPAEVADLRRSLEGRGLTQYLSTQLGGAEATLHDASGVLGHDLEIHVDGDALRDFFGMVSGAAEGWDGSDPLRPVAS